MGSLEDAVLDLQERVKILEGNRRAKQRAEEHTEAQQSEIDKVLFAEGQRSGALQGDSWVW